MQAVTQITRGEIGVRERLASLGLKPEDFIEAIQFGESHRALCTPDDPPSFHGVTAWARTVRGLRIGRLFHENWKADDSGNYSTLLNPDKTLAIAVATGDDETGVFDPDRPLAQPKLKHPKGNMTRFAIARNRLVRFLFPDMAADAKAKLDKLVTAATRSTWILLRRRKQDIVYAELSLPWNFSDAGQVSGWKHRIILDPLEVEPIIDVRDDSGDDSGEVIDVPVRRI